MSDLIKELTDACMCGEQFYGRPCIFCQSRERIAELEVLLKVARCPNTQCTDGAIPHGPNPDGTWEVEQCQWCYEREQALGEKE